MASVIAVIFMDGRKQGAGGRERARSPAGSHAQGSPSLGPSDACDLLHPLLFCLAFPKRNCLERPLPLSRICCFLKLKKKKKTGVGSLKKKHKVLASVPNSQIIRSRLPRDLISQLHDAFRNLRLGASVPLLHSEASLGHVAASRPPILTPGRWRERHTTR